MHACDWFETPMGRFLLEQERSHCRKLLPHGYYPSSLQAGQPSLNFLEQLETERQFFIGECALDTTTHLPAVPKPERPTACPIHCAVAKASAMPFASKTHNLMVLPHTLDFCEDPHAVLREVNHILVSQGCIVITGFNRFSLWRAFGLLRNAARRPPWIRRCYRVSRVQDWLALLGFELVGAGMLAYQIPLQSAKWRRRLGFIEKAGARWWPGLGAVYIIVGRKEEIAGSGRARAQRKWQRLMMPGLARPATPSAANVARKSQDRST